MKSSLQNRHLLQKKIQATLSKTLSYKRSEEKLERGSIAYNNFMEILSLTSSIKDHVSSYKRRIMNAPFFGRDYRYEYI